MILKVGLIGAGGFGTIHAIGFSRNPNCKLVAIASRTEDHARDLAKKFNIPNFYPGNNGWEQMIENEQLDIVSICTPNYLHAPISLKAIEKDRHILCEKPIAISREELSQIESKLIGKDLVFFTSFQKRYKQIFKLIKSVLDEEVLGRITLVRYYFSHYGPYKSWKAISEERWFFDSKKAGGGVLLDLGVHCIDILQSLLGDYDHVDGATFSTDCIDMEDEDNCSVLFRFKNGESGVISVSWCNEPLETIDIFGTKGYIKVNLSEGKLSVFGPRSLRRIKPIKNLVNFRPMNELTQNMLIDHFINCIQTKKQESPNFYDGKKAVEFVLDAYSFKK
ncbi:MAG: Gfo/Idh/MocA family protein [Candidatus Hermodarchaeota archaeon]